jgi:hypothetical protein
LAPSTPSQPGEWAFGAGAQAITFVRRLDGAYYLELPRTWYRTLGGYARTPGHTSDSGIRDRIFDPSAAILRCFACHTTGPLTVSSEKGIGPNELGVRCEACHGPSAAHVANPARTRPRNPGRMSAGEINGLCGQCHRMPAKQHDETSLRNPWNVRHQPFMLAASKCFVESAGKLSCFQCHAPHGPLETKTSAYNRACLQCHPQVSHKPNIAVRACIGCHMPAVTPQTHLAFANHRIGIYSPSNSLVPVSAARVPAR